MSWHVSRAGQVLGPFEDAELQARFAAGTIAATDSLARQGEPQWRPAAQVFPDRFPPSARRSRFGVAALLALFVPACWAGLAGMGLVYQQVSDPLRANTLGLAILAACGGLMALIAIGMLWVKVRSGGHLGTGLVVGAFGSALVALPGLGLALLHFLNIAASDAGVLHHQISLNEHGQLLMQGGVGRTLAHDLEALLAGHEGDLVVRIDNAGGVVDAAEAAGNLLGARGAFTARVDGECASACVLLLTAADRIELYADSRICLHRPSSMLSGERMFNEDASIGIFVERLTRAGFGTRAIAAVSDVPADDMLWLAPTTHADDLPAYVLLDDDGLEVDDGRRDVALAKDVVGREMPRVGAAIDVIYDRFPQHALQGSQALLAAHARDETIYEALHELIDMPFGAALSATSPQAGRAWLANLVKLDEQFDWETPGGACYGHAAQPKARRAALARASEVIVAAADGAWDEAPPLEENAKQGVHPWRWPGTPAEHDPEADANCRGLLATARELSDAPDERLLAGLARRPWLPAAPAQAPRAP